MGALADSEPTAPGGGGLGDGATTAYRGCLLGLRVPVATGGPVPLVRAEQASVA